MKWTQAGPEAIQSGVYRISRCRVVGKERFTLWKGSKRIAGPFDDAREARAAANADADSAQDTEHTAG